MTLTNKQYHRFSLSLITMAILTTPIALAEDVSHESV
jgi:hypothetical protein